MELVQDLLVSLQSLKTACETVGIDPSLLQWAVTVIIAVSIVIGTLVRSYKVTTAVVRWVVPSDEIAEKIITALNDSSVTYDPLLGRLNNGKLSVKLIFDKYENVSDVCHVCVGDSMLAGYSVLSRRSKARIRDAANSALSRWRFQQRADMRKETIAALKAI